MKKIILMACCCCMFMLVSVQGKSKDKGKEKIEKEGKEKTGKKSKEKTAKSANGKSNSRQPEEVIWEGTANEGGKAPKISKNQPAKVRAAFQRDYPNAQNVTWSKYRGDWTASFSNGIGYSVAVYHANGDRRDTRTVIQRTELPVKVEDIIKKRPQTKIEDVIKIEIPQSKRDIFRMKSLSDGVQKFLFYDADGNEVNYDY